MNYDALPDGWFSQYDVAEYRRLIESLPDKAFIAELGAWKGRSMCSIADLILSKGLQVVAVDTFGGTDAEVGPYDDVKKMDIMEVFKENIRRYGLQDKVLLLKNTTVEAAKFFDILPRKFDMVFIDADHSYEAVKRDIDDWSPKIKTGGIIAGHDITAWEGLRRAVGEHYPDHQSTGNIWRVQL